MWNHSKSLILSTLWVKVTLIMWGGFAPILLLAMISNQLFIEKEVVIIAVVIWFPIFHILRCLYGLLQNITQGKIFVSDNVSYLRKISWCCFFAGMILLAGSVWETICFLLSAMIGFFGLLMRVVKNILAEAIVIKQENDDTI